jgi:putative hydrolase of the HAD superfamily
VSGTRLIIWDFDGTLAHRRGETGWSILLAEALEAEDPGHGHSADTFRPHLREGFPWHQPEIAHPELCEPEAWWACGPAVLGGRRGGGYEAARASRWDDARGFYVDLKIAGELFGDTLPFWMLVAAGRTRSFEPYPERRSSRRSSRRRRVPARPKAEMGAGL